MKKIFIDSIQTFTIKLMFIISPIVLIILTFLLYSVEPKNEVLLFLCFIPLQCIGGIYIHKRIKKRTGFLITTDGVLVNDEKIFNLEEIVKLEKVSSFEYHIVLKNEAVYRLYMTKDQYEYVKENFNL